MRTCLRAVLIALAAVSLLGCTSAYVNDRAMDLADCFKFHGGVAAGVDAQLQATDWLATGVGGVMDSQKVGWEGRHYTETREYHLGFPFMPFLAWCEYWPFERQGDKPLKDVVATFGPYLTHAAHRTLDQTRAAPAEATAGSVHRLTASVVLFNLLAGPAVEEIHGTGARTWKLVNAFDLDLGVSALLAVRVGLSPGQFLDFVIGFTTLDLAHDDGT